MNTLYHDTSAFTPRKQPAVIFCPECETEGEKYPGRRLCMDCGKEYYRKQALEWHRENPRPTKYRKGKCWNETTSNDFLRMKL